MYGRLFIRLPARTKYLPVLRTTSSKWREYTKFEADEETAGQGRWISATREREIDDCQVETGLRATNEIGILRWPNVERIVEAFRADRSQLFNLPLHIELRFSKLAINDEKARYECT